MRSMSGDSSFAGYVVLLKIEKARFTTCLRTSMNDAVTGNVACFRCTLPLFLDSFSIDWVFESFYIGARRFEKSFCKEARNQVDPN